MSYDIYLRCATCKESPVHHDPTYNFTEVFDFVFTGEPYPNPEISQLEEVVFAKNPGRPRGLRRLNGLTGEGSLTLLRKALAHLQDPSQREKLETILAPNNGWGDLPGAVTVCNYLIESAQKYPQHHWDVG